MTDSDTVLSRRLDAFDTGAPFHKNADQFCEVIVAAIHEREAHGAKISRIVVRGYADGTPNFGIRQYSALQFPPACRRALSIPIYDPELAAARGCVVMEMLTARIGAAASAAVVWKPEKVDLKDGQDSSPLARRVEVEVQFSR